MTEDFAPAPQPSFRLIPSKFPPIGLFDSVATAADMGAVMELAGWTNDRLVAERINRLPESQWVYGRANASVIMAAFLHVAPTGMRFNKAELGAWYAAGDLTTAVAEVGHHLRREAIARQTAEARRRYRIYQARIDGEYTDIRAARMFMPELYDPASYAASQIFGETVRTSGGNGILYESVRLHGGVNIAAYRPTKILEVLQTDHLEISVFADHQRIDVQKLVS